MNKPGARSLRPSEKGISPASLWSGGERFLLAGIFLLSLSAVGYEVLLLRLFSVVQWYHFASLILSLALLGYGAAGTFLSLIQDHLVPRASGAITLAAAGFGLAALAGFGLSQRVDFNPLEIVWDPPGQLLNFLIVYLILAVPFFFAALGIGIALAARKEWISRIYRADLAGGAAGSAGVIALLFLFQPSDAARWLGGGGLAAAALFYAAKGGNRRKAAAGLAIGLFLAAAWPARWLALDLSSYKELSRSLDIPGTEIVSVKYSPLAMLTALRSPWIPFRHAPGLSLAFRGEIPEQIALFTDGDFAGVINRAKRGEEKDIFRYMLSSAPYQILNPHRVLILKAGGGSEVLAALVHGAAKIDAVEINPQIVAMVREEFGDFSSHLYNDERVEVSISEPRSFIVASKGNYDLIQLSLLGDGGAGVHSLRENYLFTVESFRRIFSLLQPDGVFSLTCSLNLPPRESLKIIATIVTAWRLEGRADPATCLAVIRNWDAVTLLAKRTPFRQQEISALVGFSRSKFFDIDYFFGIEPELFDRFNRLDPPWLREGTTTLLGPGRERFIRAYKFAIEPPTDDRPFFFRFFRWSTLPEVMAARERGGAFLVDWGYLLLVFALVQSLAIGTIFILLPLAFSRRKNQLGKRKGAVVVYFASLGLAFLFVEIAFIQKFILYLGHPVFATSLVVAAFLLFAGLGSGFSGRYLFAAHKEINPTTLHASRPRSSLEVFPLMAGGMLLLYLFLLPLMTGITLGKNLPVKAIFSLLLIAPPAFLMGMPFPLGLKRLGQRSPAGISWAWGINGFASVVSALLANLAAIHLGIMAVIGLGAALYLLAAFAFRLW